MLLQYHDLERVRRPAAEMKVHRVWRCGTSAIRAQYAHLSIALLVASQGPPAWKDFRQSPSEPKTAATAHCSIAGTVRRASGAAVTGARVTLVADGASPRQVVITDSEGHFVFGVVEPGRYTIQVESNGFRKSRRSRLVVDSPKRLVADFCLVPEGRGHRAPPQSGAPAETEKNGPSLGGFNYYDQTEFKPGKVNASVDPGGYSAAQQVDHDNLILDYLEAEGATTRPDKQRATTEGTNVRARSGSELLPPAAELDSWSEARFLSRASDLLVNHDLVASVDTFQAGIARFPNSAKLETGLGIALSARGDYLNAVASLVRATDLRPSDPHPYFVLAKVYLSSSAASDEVPQRLQRLVALDPRNSQARYYCALALAKGSANDESILKQIESLLQSAIALDANFAEAHLQLGILYASRSNYPEAIREYQSAVILKPDLVAAHYRLAQAYARQGDKATAQRELDLYERLRQHTPTPPH